MRLRPFAWCVATLVVFSGGLSGPARGRAAGETRRALLVGIDRYLPVPAGSGTPPVRRAIGNLEGAVNDVDAMRAVLVARYGFKPENVHVLRNAEATRNRILSETRAWLVRAAAAGDVSVFYYAGHGSQVRNSLSAEIDKMDETIVPADANLGRPDIRDKELARAFDEVLDKRVVLTAIFDSCHSGSIARGLPQQIAFRFVAPDSHDVADPDAPVPPETRGALILSAAQDLQSAGEVRVSDENDAHHGLFTWALVKALRTLPANESAERVFLSVRGLMQSGPMPQEPVLAGSDVRRHATLFGSTPPTASGVVLAVESVAADGSVLLQGGRAAGVRQGAELDPTHPPSGPRLRVIEEQGLAYSRATVISGNAASLKLGALFTVSKWAAPAGEALHVWMRSSRLSAAQIVADAGALGAGRLDPRFDWVDDPTASGDTAVRIERTDAGWQLAGADRPVTPLGATFPAAASLLPLFAAPQTSARRVRVNLPVPAEVAAELRSSAAAADALFDLRANVDEADYALVGRVRNGVPEYTWVRPLATDAASTISALPVRSAWVPLGADPKLLAARLRDLAMRLSVLHGWLQLEAPADAGTFPYHLALKQATTGDTLTGGTTRAGDVYRLVLTRDEALHPTRADRRYVYAFTIDSDGTSTLLFPRATGGNVENLLPVDRDLPAEIPLGPRGLFRFSPGVDTFLLLTTATALPDPTALQGDAVRADARGLRDPLSQLLVQGGAGKRAVTVSTPVDWSLERFTVRTLAASATTQ